ncbi:hypothetical protein FB451DRAFT_1422954 [Mycena latifolia]|nr:hypothetical protein FB451DRAFT_1422954 [Mycena latifolia]
MARVRVVPHSLRFFYTTCISVYAAGLSAAGVKRAARSGNGRAEGSQSTRILQAHTKHQGTRTDGLKGYAVHVPPSASLMRWEWEQRRTLAGVNCPVVTTIVEAMNDIVVYPQS